VSDPVRVVFFAGSHGDWGGKSRVVFTLLRLLNRQVIEPVVVLPKPGPIQPVLADLGITHEVWGDLHDPGGGPMGLLRYAWDVLHLGLALRRLRPAVVHMNYSNFWRPAEVLAARWLGIPAVAHQHVVVRRPGPYLRYMARLLPVSDFVARACTPVGVPTTTLHNAVDLERFNAARDVRAELGLPAQATVISFLGQVREQKGIQHFVELPRRIRDPDVWFLIAGECRDPGRFEGAWTEERLRESLAGDPRVVYAGYRSDPENLYRSSDVVVVPSQWDEPFGLILIEAGASGKPVVATRSGGMPEVVRDGENGLLVERADVEGLVTAVRRLVDDVALRRAMGSNARRVVEEEFSTKPVRVLEGVLLRLAQARRTQVARVA